MEENTVQASPSVEVQEEGESLLSKVQESIAEPGENSENSVSEAENSWYFAEDIPGVGEKPEWFNDGTFKSVADQAKAQVELRKKLGAFSGAPEDGYEIQLDEAFKDVQLDDSDPILNEFAAFAAQNNMSQEGFNGLLNLYMHHTVEEEKAMNHQTQEAWKSELNSLGPNAIADLKVLDQWGKNNIPEELYPTFREMASSANAVRLLQHLRQGKAATPIVPSEGASAPDRSKLRQMMQDPRYVRDQYYTKEVDALAKRLYG